MSAAKAGMLSPRSRLIKGWTVKVDGEKVETRKAFGAFLAIDVSAGDHVIDFSYFPEGLKTGGLISGGSIVILILLWFCAGDGSPGSEKDETDPEHAAGRGRRS